MLSCKTSMNALKFLEIVTNQLLKSFSVRTKFYISNISQFHLKREILNQIGSNNSAKLSIYLKTIPKKMMKTSSQIALFRSVMSCRMKNQINVLEPVSAHNTIRQGQDENCSTKLFCLEKFSSKKRLRLQ